MQVIHKYELDVNTDLELPEGAEILSVAFQQNKLCLWAKVDTDVDTETRSFRVFGTGENIPCGNHMSWSFVGTAFSKGEIYVFHVFELI